MSSLNIPSTMKVWQYSSTAGGIEKNVKINSSAPLPHRKSDQHLVKVISAAINPVDYKVPEIGLMWHLTISKPATPASDFVGRVVVPADGSSMEPGQLVFGWAGSNAAAGGAMAEYAVAGKDATALVPQGVDLTSLASIGIAGLTAYQSLAPYVSEGKSVFINGGSGGTGVFGIQIAKAMGATVATSCSTVNVELCTNLGADYVVDYKKSSVVDALKSSGRMFDHIVDNVGGNSQIFYQAHTFTNPGSAYLVIGAQPGLSFVLSLAKMFLLPSFLGGGKRSVAFMGAKPKKADLEQVGKWMAAGQVKAVIDSEYSFEDLPKAIEQLKTGRTKGKIVVHVAPETAA